MMEALSKTRVLRDIRQELDRAKHVASIPAVLWAGIEEPAEDFALRCAALQLSGADRVIAAVPHGFVVPDGIQAVEFSNKLFWLLHPSVSIRYRAASGGRGSGRSRGITTYIILDCLQQKSRWLCTREYQRSLSESVHLSLSKAIDRLEIGDFFEIRNNEIECVNGSQVIFSGLFQNSSQLKSMEGITRCFVEEAQTLSSDSKAVLTPTIREPGSEIIFSWNPDQADAPVQEFASVKRDDTRHVHMTFADNPWWPQVLEDDRKHSQSVDYDAYNWIWLGNCRTISDAQVFARKSVIEDFTPAPNTVRDRRKDMLASLGRGDSILKLEQDDRETQWNGPYLGADWGFSSDPTTLVLCWIFQRTLYIEHEAYKVKCDLDDTPALFDQVPDARKHRIYADSARPESVSFMRKYGYPLIESVEKKKGSVEDGIAFIRSFERVVIHPRCKHAADEFKTYSYVLDRLTGLPTTKLEDRNNHIVDAVRYALSKVMKHRQGSTVSPLRV